MTSAHKAPLPVRRGFRGSPRPVRMVPSALASKISNEPPKWCDGHLGGSFVIPPGQPVLNDHPPRICRACGSIGIAWPGSASWSIFIGSIVRRERSHEQVAVSCHLIAGGEPEPAPGCSALRRAPGVCRLACQGERFARRRTGRQSDLGPKQPRHLAREDRVGVDPRPMPLQEPGAGPLR